MTDREATRVCWGGLSPRRLGVMQISTRRQHVGLPYLTALAVALLAGGEPDEQYNTLDRYAKRTKNKKTNIKIVAHLTNLLRKTVLSISLLWTRICFLPDLQSGPGSVGDS